MFTKAVDAAVAIGGDALQKDCVLSALHKCCLERLAAVGSEHSLNPESLKNAIGLRFAEFRGPYQQDAHEFFCRLSEAVQSEVLSIEVSRRRRWQIYASETSDPSTRVFGFAIEDEIQCQECFGVRRKTEQYTNLSVDTPGESSTDRTIQSMLSSFFRKEAMSCDCPNCSRKMVIHTKQPRLKRIPQVLVVHVKRFDSQTGGKIASEITISTEVQLRPYANRNVEQPLQQLSACTTTTAAGAVRNESVADTGERASAPAYHRIPEIVEDDAIAVHASSGRHPIAFERPDVVAIEPDVAAQHALARYELISTISHLGNAANVGHYIAAARSTDTEWRKFDDEKVTTISTTEAVDGQMVKSNGYMLFYKISPIK